MVTLFHDIHSTIAYIADAVAWFT